jgi:hypothetical protein
MKDAALGVLFGSTLAIAVVYALAFLPGGPPAWATPLFAVAIAAMIVALMVIGALRRGSIGPLAPVFAFAFLVVAGGFCFALLLPDPPVPGVLWLGLPPAAAVVMYGVGLLPLVVVPIAYGVTFRSTTLSAADLERIREARDVAESARARSLAERAVPNVHVPERVG